MTDEPKLLPCPFCGRMLARLDLPRRYNHPVGKCILSGRNFAPGFIGQWNTRADLPLARNQR